MNLVLPFDNVGSLPVKLSPFICESWSPSYDSGPSLYALVPLFAAGLAGGGLAELILESTASSIPSTPEQEIYLHISAETHGVSLPPVILGGL